MNLESIAKYFAPKSPMFSDSPRATASDSLTGTDVMAALGLAGHKCGFGFDLYLSKIGISSPDIALEDSMSRHVSYQVNSEHCLNSMNQLGQACLRFSALLHTRLFKKCCQHSKM